MEGKKEGSIRIEMLDCERHLGRIDRIVDQVGGGFLDVYGIEKIESIELRM